MARYANPEILERLIYIITYILTSSLLSNRTSILAHSSRRNQMSIWALLGVVVAAGALGGAINALMTDNGFRLPKWDEVGGARIWRPGWIANVVVGLSAAAVSWGLYGPYANDVLVGTQSSTTPQNFILTLSSVVGAFLVGIGGSRYLTSQVMRIRLAPSDR
jgi:hypothetical protein